MKPNGSRFYDNDEFFKTYWMRRQNKENPNDTIEKPILEELIGNVSNLSILDLGCGDAWFGSELVASGCKSYLGIEGSLNMFNEARENLKNLDNAHVIHTAIEDWGFPKAIYDIVVSRLVLHYIEDIETVFHKAYESLRQGGRLIFSIEHPVITSTLQTNGLRTNWLVDNYFSQGIRKQIWLGAEVYKYHRSTEWYFSSLQKVGFTIETLKEGCPQRENFESEETYNRRIRIPVFLILACRK